jgi:hypothetical protein
MQNMIRIFGCFLLLLMGCSLTMAAGSGDVKIGYIFIDETGNLSVDRSTFNDYAGPSISLENFRYSFDNGTVLRASLRNAIMNNRNLTAEIGKPGLYSLKASHNQFRRVYDFEGSHFTRRHQESVAFSLFPVRYLEFFGGGAYMGRSGATADLFNPTPAPATVNVDYKQTFYNGGVRLRYQALMLQAEYRGNQFRDNDNASRDQDRTEGRVSGLLRLPQFDRLTVTGGFRHFETKYTKADFLISSNRAWGGVWLELPADFSFRYFFSIDRTSSDSDYVATDNIVHAVYVGYTRLKLAGVTIGYQHDLNDKYFEQAQGNALYASGWLKPVDRIELRAEYGTRAEDVKEGVRLVGNEERNRHKVSVKCRYSENANIALKYEGKTRKNDDIGSKTTFNRAAIDGTYKLAKYGVAQVGYAYVLGKYENATQNFEFADHLVYGDINSAEYHNLTVGIGGTYCRSWRDLNVESSNLRFTAGYRIPKDYRVEVIYNVHNFDDFLVRDQYYTSNIIEVNLIKGLSF